MSLSITGWAPTTRADRYAKQLASHLSGSLPVTVVGATSSIEFKGVRGSVTVTETGLEIAISGPGCRAAVSWHGCRRTSSGPIR